MRTAFAWTLALGCTVGAAAAADRTPAEILKDYDAVESPKFDREKKYTPEEMKAFREAAARAAERKAALAWELFEAEPDHPRAAEVLIPRWIEYMMGRETAPRTVMEIDRALDHLKDPERRKVARNLRAIAVVESHPDDPAAGLAEVDKFLADYPKDPSGASLLGGFASSVNDPGFKRKLLDRLVADFPGSPAAESAEKAIAALELVGKPFALAFDDAVSGAPVSTEALKGKVVVIDLWATWCGPCVADMPNMKKLHEEYKDRGVAFLAVNLDEGDDGRAKMKEFVAKNDIPWPQLCDGKAWESPVVEKLGVRAIPTVAVIDRDGNLAELDAHGRLAEVLPRLLGGAAPAR